MAVLAAGFTMTPVTWNFSFLKHQTSPSTATLTQRFQCPGSEVQASATLVVSRDAPICFVALPHYDVQFVMLRLPAHPELDHCRDALEGQRNGSHPVFYLVVARVHWQQQPATDPLEECECKFGGLTSASTASIWPTTLHAFVDSGHSLSAGPNTDMKSSVASLSLRITLLSSQQVAIFCAT